MISDISDWPRALEMLRSEADPSARENIVEMFAEEMNEMAGIGHAASDFILAAARYAALGGDFHEVQHAFIELLVTHIPEFAARQAHSARSQRTRGRPRPRAQKNIARDDLLAYLRETHDWDGVGRRPRGSIKAAAAHFGVSTSTISDLLTQN